jgi:MFS family permease
MPRIAVTAVFVAHGLLFASWTAHIPHVMRHLGLTDGTLGIALLGAPAGSVAAMLLASYLIPKLGSRRVVQLALVGYCAIDRSPRITRLPVSGTRSPALPDRVRGRRHPSVPCLA